MSNDSVENKDDFSGGVPTEPYRTPAEISDDGVPETGPRSKRMWFAILGLLAVAGGAMAMYALRPVDHIKNFGDVRRGPVEDFDIEFDDVSFDEHVSDFGATRRGYPVQVPVDGTAPPSQKGFQPDVPDFTPQR